MILVVLCIAYVTVSHQQTCDVAKYMERIGQISYQQHFPCASEFQLLVSPRGVQPQYRPTR
jgi:hypothetical protein